MFETQNNAQRILFIRKIMFIGELLKIRGAQIL